MKLQGNVLKKFRDKDNQTYAPLGYAEEKEYTEEKIVYPAIYIGEQKRYEELEQKGYVGKGKLVNEKKIRNEEE